MKHVSVNKSDFSIIDSINLNESKNLLITCQVGIEAVMTGGPNGDMAVDSIEMSPGRCEGDRTINIFNHQDIDNIAII